MRGHSIGGYGSVTTNKVIATIVGDLFGLHVQAYPTYGSVGKAGQGKREHRKELAQILPDASGSLRCSNHDRSDQSFL